MLIKRYETRGKKYWLELLKDDTYGYSYKGNGMGGNLGNIPEVEALFCINKIIEGYKSDGINLTEVKV